MINLSNGHGLVFCAASGALAYDGKGWAWEYPLCWMGALDPSLFTVITKTLTRQPRKGNLYWYHPWTCVKQIGREGWVNAVGLTNPGIEWWCRKHGPTAGAQGIPIIVSITADTVPELVKMGRMVVGSASHIVGIEFNPSCPNTESSARMTENAGLVIEQTLALKEAIGEMPLLIKLSVVQNAERILQGVQGCVEAVQINSVPWHVAFPNKQSPLHRLGGGGVSGKVAQQHTWRFIERLVKASTIPVIGCSVWEYEGDCRRVGDSA